MGFKDVLDSAVNGLKPSATNAWEGSYNLGSAAINGIKTSASDAWGSSYDIGSAAVKKIDDTVRGNNGIEKLKGYVQIGPESQEKIGQARSILTHPASKELFKALAPPGGAQAFNIVSTLLNNPPSTEATQSFSDNKRYEQVMEQLKVLRDENERIRADLKSFKETESPNKLTSTPLTDEEKPENVISVFMMKGLKVTDFMDDQVVPPPVTGQFHKS